MKMLETFKRRKLPTTFKVEWEEGGVLHSIGGFQRHEEALDHAKSILLDENFVSKES